MFCMCVAASDSRFSKKIILCGYSQAYDGHMNLILSDVEETIMIVDSAEGLPEGRGTVNVRPGAVV